MVGTRCCIPVDSLAAYVDTGERRAEVPGMLWARHGKQVSTATMNKEKRRGLRSTVNSVGDVPWKQGRDAEFYDEMAEHGYEIRVFGGKMETGWIEEDTTPARVSASLIR